MVVMSITFSRNMGMQQAVKQKKGHEDTSKNSCVVDKGYAA
jgi:hypothetical protein